MPQPNVSGAAVQKSFGLFLSFLIYQIYSASLIGIIRIELIWIQLQNVTPIYEDEIDEEITEKKPI